MERGLDLADYLVSIIWEQGDTAEARTTVQCLDPRLIESIIAMYGTPEEGTSRHAAMVSYILDCPLREARWEVIE